MIPQWRTGDGRRVAVPAMTDAHLMNTIRWLRRRISDLDQEWEETMLFYGSFDPESMASYYAEGESDHLLTRLLAHRAWMKVMERERQRRGI